MFRQSPVAPRMTSRRAAPPRPSDEAPEPDVVFDEEAATATSPRDLRPVELGPIIRSKIQPPALRPSTLSRQRLLDQLTEATSHRLTLLIAEAGYGKTTLLADFARSAQARVMWYRLDSTDADIVEWTNYLIAAIREFDNFFGASTADLLKEIPTGGPPKASYISSFISELASLDIVPTLLVLDDFHLVDGRPEPVEFVSRLIRDAPPWLHVVISTRRKPDLAFGRLTVTGELVSIEVDDLRFSRAEIARLFDEEFGTPLDDDILAAVNAKTMGWVASLQLFHRSMQGRSPAAVRSLARALSGATGPIYDFLAEEVLTNLAVDVERMLIRASIVKNVSPVVIEALLADVQPPATPQQLEVWIDEADRMGLLTRTSNSSDALQLHPLLRDFLAGQLRQRETHEAVCAMHLRVARAIADADPLTAAHHLAEAGLHADAMHALGASLLLTVGSGRWGDAAELIAKLSSVPADASVAAIRARQLIEDGDLDAAATLLESVDVSASTADVRAVFRHTQVSLGWRTGNRELMFAALREIEADRETPPVLREIAEVLLDASPVSTCPAPLPEVGKRLRAMAATMTSERLTYYSAIGLHDSAIAFLNAGDYQTAREVGSEALDRFSNLTFFAPEQLSTHTTLAICEQELGNDANSVAHARAAVATGREFVDVSAELALMSTALGDSERAAELVTRARIRQRQHLTDGVGDSLLECALALADMRTKTDSALTRLRATHFDSPLELGYSLARETLLAQALLVSGNSADAARVTSSALDTARSRHARRSEVRLAILDALANGDRDRLRVALVDGESAGELALLELADAIMAHIELIGPGCAAIDRSIAKRPHRWLPAIRRRLESGNTANARTAAAMLDEYGTLQDVGLLRAYAKTYAKRGPSRELGRALARRTSPALRVHDLGRVRLTIADRAIEATTIRRKPAAVLMYLITRSGFVANREQIIDDLWPQADPSGGTNNLNQSLHFLRREIDPWHEDDISVDYVRFQGELVWLDPELVIVDSAELVRRSRECRDDISEATSLLETYEGRFALEFEYEDWAMGWRSRVHSTFLELSNWAIERLVADADLSAALKLAANALEVDSEATDIELRLIWLLGRLGLLSAARLQHEHLTHADEEEGLETITLSKLLDGPFPGTQ